MSNTACLSSPWLTVLDVESVQESDACKSEAMPIYVDYSVLYPVSSVLCLFLPSDYSECLTDRLTLYFGIVEGKLCLVIQPCLAQGLHGSLWDKVPLVMKHVHLEFLL